MQIERLNTSTDAVNFWAARAAEFDALLGSLDNELLPASAKGGELPITDDTRDQVREAFEQARLAADTVLGAYSRMVWIERTGGVQNGYQQLPNTNGQPQQYSQQPATWR